MSESGVIPKQEKRFSGIAVAPGIAHGEAVVHWLDDEDVPARKIEAEELPEEIARFESALIATRAELLELQQRIADAIGAKDASVFDAHLLVVEDRTLIDEVLRSLERDRNNVEYTFQQVAGRYCKTLSQIDDPYLRERVVDIEDVARRVIQHLLGKTPHTIASRDKPHIIISRNLTPSDTASLNRAHVLGFATELGSKTSHTAIMARSMDIPAVVGMHDLCAHIETGDDVLLDGYSGLVILNPSPDTLHEYGRLELRKEEVEERLELLRDTVCATTDGRRVTLSANIELPEELDDVLESGAEGVGLYRTEFLFLNREEIPDEEEQYENYRIVAQRAGQNYVIIRTLDIGGDKFAKSLDVPEEHNPFLGFRAIRFCLKNPDIFKTQLRAILRAGAATGNVRIMYPMISGAAELREANALLEESKQELRDRGVPFLENIEVGAMIEIPSAALVADHLAKEVKFFSIGTNDLIQYTLAVDRGNDLVAHLYKPTHPAVIRLIDHIIRAAHDNGIWAGVCGEMAADVLLTPLLVGLGIDELSTSSSVLPRVKKAVQSLDLATCQNLAREALKSTSTTQIMDACLEVAKANYVELID